MRGFLLVLALPVSLVVLAGVVSLALWLESSAAVLPVLLEGLFPWIS